ncbi:MAG: DUF2891 domain-containing protein [Hyphomonadaceae bacterium]|jgi:hypothetical protein
MRRSLLSIFALCLATMTSTTTEASGFEEATARFATLALSCIHTEYPNKIAHVLNSAEDARTPSQLTPAFYGCFDHHSSVHGHWLLARLARLYPQAPYTPAARQALAKSLTKANLEAELAYMNAPGRAGFERPYGLAWMLQLGAELRQWAKQDASVAAWAADFAPLEQRAAGQLKNWLPKLRTPMRVGEHSQTAFALGLARDWAVEAQDKAFLALIDERAMSYFGKDRDCPLRFEPGGEDFVSACLGEADLIRRVLAPQAYAKWLSIALPTIPKTASADWLPVGIVTDRTDGKLAHTDGLNLSRAWMLEGMAAGLPAHDKRRLALLAAAKAHRDIALPAVTGEHYEGGHWLGTFATYLVTQRGLKAGH